ncbi:MAG: hypothetical protein RLZZ524_3054 [Pseudomonadota bacterium]|jgi:chromosome segregation ATPase
MADDKQTTSTEELRQAVQSGLRMFRAFKFGDDALAVIENIEQVTRERQEAAAAALASLESVSAELVGVKADLVKAKADAKDMRAKAKADAESRISDAQAKADALTTDAEGKATAVRAQTEALVADLLAKNAELNELLAKIGEAQATIERADRAREALKLAAG